MNIVRFNPWRDFDDLLNQPFSSVLATANPATSNHWLPDVDIFETESEYLIELDIPAVAVEDVEVSVKEGVLTVSGERKPRTSAESDTRHRTERRFGRFARSFRLSKNLDEKDIHALAKNGVLTLKVGKKAKDEPRRIEVAAA